MASKTTLQLRLEGKRISDLIEMQAMQTQRMAFGCLYIPRSRPEIIVVGGEDEERQVLKSCELLDVESNSWRYLPDCNQPRFRSSICLLKHFIFCFGGGNQNFFKSDTIEMIDTSTKHQEWKLLLVRLPEQVHLIACVPISPSELLIFGSHFGSDAYIFSQK